MKDLSKLSVTLGKMEWEERKFRVHPLLEMGIQGALPGSGRDWDTWLWLWIPQGTGTRKQQQGTHETNELHVVIEFS